MVGKKKKNVLRFGLFDWILVMDLSNKINKFSFGDNDLVGEGGGADGDSHDDKCVCFGCVFHLSRESGLKW